MAKKVIAEIKLQIPAGAANPSPPVGPGARPARRQHHGVLQGVQRPDAGQAGLIIPVIITVYADRSFTFITKTPPASVLLKGRRASRRARGEPGKKKVGQGDASSRSRRSRG